MWIIYIWNVLCFLFFCLFICLFLSGLPPSPSSPTSSTFPLGPTVILFLSLWVSLYTLISITRDAMLQNECFEAAEAYVSPSAKRPAKSETTLWKIYIQISSTPHTSYHTLNAIYTATCLQSRGWEVSCFLVVFMWLMGRKKKNTEAQWGPLVSDVASAAALQGFSSPSLLPSAVLSLCSHTVCVFAVRSAADLRQTLQNRDAFKRTTDMFGEADC